MANSKKQENIGKYEIREQIGAGGFGIVYRGRDPLLDRDVAIKVLKSEAATSPEFIERFRREARLAASLNHPNVVHVIEVGEQEGRYFIVMDFLSGGPLSKLLKEGKPLLIPGALEILKPVADALDYIHRKGMIHRDVKPSNIILNEDGAPVLTDFGLGKNLLEEGGTTTTGMELGTAEYMAPEQILGIPPGSATDLYALGVVAFQILTGKVPFSGNTPFTIQKGHVDEAPPDPRRINSDLDEEISTILLHSLEKEPSARFQSGADFIAALSQAVLRHEEGYYERLYQEAKGLMDRALYVEALEKWKRLQSAKPGYKDVTTQESRAQLQIDLGVLYADVVNKIEEAKAQAQSIISKDKAFPDSKGVLELLGMYHQFVSHPFVQPISSPVTKENPAGIEWIENSCG